jgi:hypothetical protein
MVIAQTSHTPMVVASFEEGIISIKGKIIPENPDEFFHQLELLTQKCLETKKTGSLQVNIQLDYFNTPSSKMLAKYFKWIIPGQPRIFWHFEKGDDAIREAGEDYSTMLGYLFEPVEI